MSPSQLVPTYCAVVVMSWHAVHPQYKMSGGQRYDTTKVSSWHTEPNDCIHPWLRHQMVTFYGVTDPLCGEFTDHRWVPLINVSDAELLMFFFDLRLKNGWVNSRDPGLSAGLGWCVPVLGWGGVGDVWKAVVQLMFGISRRQWQGHFWFSICQSVHWNLIHTSNKLHVSNVTTLLEKTFN